MANVSKVQIGTTNMRYAKFGAGDKIMCVLPGMSVNFVTDSADAVEKMYEKYLGEYTVYLFDRTDEIPKDYSISDMADDTYTVMKKLGIDKAYMYGVSQGGMILLSLLSKHTECAKAVIVASSCARNTEKFNSRYPIWKKLAKQKEKAKFAEIFAENVYSPEIVAKYGNSVKMPIASCSDELFDRFVRMADANNGFDVLNEICKIKSPALVIGTKGDNVIGVEGTEEIADNMKCEQYIYPESYGHAVYDEAADFTDRIFAFFGKY